MKLPNSYGSVIKLGGKRRKPYAVRISKLVEDDTGKVKRKYTYLAYFSKPEMAYTYLAEYNSGAVVRAYEILGLAYFCRDVREMEEIPKIA